MSRETRDQELRQQTRQAVLDNFKRWRERENFVAPPAGYKVIFLGTGGNPEAVIGQHLRTAGFVLNFGGLRFYVDPGPGAVVHSLEAGIDLGALDGVYISHGHLDHYSGAESIIEAMCWAMSTRRGHLLAPKDVLEGDHLVSRYHQGVREALGPYKGGPKVIALQAHQPVNIKGITIIPVPAYHGGENYGFVADCGRLRLGYTSDTSYIISYRTAAGIEQVDRTPIMDMDEIVDYRHDIKETFGSVDVLIANVTTHNVWAHRHITTLGLPHILKGSRVKLCLLSHFNISCVQPLDLRQEMARYVEEVSGVKTLAAFDGSEFDFKDILQGLGVWPCAV